MELFLRCKVFASNLSTVEGEGLSVSTSQTVLQHLPSLRRYARALTGSQASGDAYVVATVESLIASPKMLESASNSRVGLYRLFTKIWNSVPVNGKPDTGEIVLPPEQHLTQITPRPRQAFLLVALEGFSEEDAAEVLDCDLQTLRGLVEESGRELAAEIATDVLIIEDETFIAMDIEALVESLGHNVIGIARTHSEALALAKQKRARAYPGRYPAGRRQFGPRRRQRAARHLRSAGHLHHRLSGAVPDRAAAGTRVPDRKAVPGCGGVSRGQPGAVLRPQSAAARPQAGGAPADVIIGFQFTELQRSVMPGPVPGIDVLRSRRTCCDMKEVRAQPIGISVAPKWPAKHGGRGKNGRPP